MPVGQAIHTIEILDAANVVKRIFANATASPLVYSAAQIANDFPSGLPSPFRFAVYQLSSVVGRGAAGTASVLFS